MPKFQVLYLAVPFENMRGKLLVCSNKWLKITLRIFLGLKFLVRNEEKDEIPCQGMRKIQGIF